MLGFIVFVWVGAESLRHVLMVFLVCKEIAESEVVSCVCGKVESYIIVYADSKCGDFSHLWHPDNVARK